MQFYFGSALEFRSNGITQKLSLRTESVGLWSKVEIRKSSIISNTRDPKRNFFWSYCSENVIRQRHIEIFSHQVYIFTRFFSYKNELYKNVEAENCRKFKNILRMFRGSNSIQHRNLSMNLHKIWWCLLLTLHFYVKTILNTALYTSLYHYRYI